MKQPAPQGDPTGLPVAIELPLTTGAPARDVRTQPELAGARLTAEPLTGIVLAGGRSERMGRDKAWVDLAGRPLVRWVLDALQLVTDAQLVVTRKVGRLDTLGVRVVVDRFDVRGPLTGIHAGLVAAETDLCVVVACDLPLVQPALVELLAASTGPSHAVVPYIGEEPLPTVTPHRSARDSGLQPLLAAYRRECVEPLERLLPSGSFPTTALISMLRARIMPPSEWRTVDPDGRSFMNVNTPEDVDRAVALTSGRTPLPGER